MTENIIIIDKESGEEIILNSFQDLEEFLFINGYEIK